MNHLWPRNGRRLVTLLSVAACTALIATGCSSSGGTSASGSTTTLAISNESGATWTCGFNPFNPGVNQQSVGFVYEPLIFTDTLKNSQPTPMLATSSAWSNNYQTLTFTIRKGVKWSDGKPFGPADVVFTFNLLKKYSGLDLNSIWSSGLESVTQSGSDQVVFQFNAPSQPYFYYVADQTSIIPEHIWSTLSNPVTYNDSKPVGTGPYTMSSCTPQNIQFTANSSYWQPGKPAVKTVNYPAYTDNGPANQDLANGKAQWGGQYIPNIQSYYVNRDKANNHYWFPPIANVSLAFNLTDPVLKDVDIRQALAYAINRENVSKIGESGYEPAANQTGIVTPTFSSWYDSSLAQQYNYTQNTDKAKELLAKAGYSTSHPLNLTVITVSGNTDWDAALQEIKQEYAPLGVNLTVQDLAGQTYNSRIYKGDFQLAYINETGGPAPYYELRQMLDSANSAPIGQDASTNYMRFKDPTVDALFNEYASASNARQHAIVDQLQQVMLTQIPVIPMTESVSWFQYSTKNFAGWPSANDPYALPAPYATPDNEQVLLHLTVK